MLREAWTWGSCALLVLALLGTQNPLLVAAKEQVQAVWEFSDGPCSPLPDTKVVEIITQVTNNITGTPWGNAIQSGTFEGICTNVKVDSSLCSEPKSIGDLIRAPSPRPQSPLPANLPSSSSPSATPVGSPKPGTSPSASPSASPKPSSSPPASSPAAGAPKAVPASSPAAKPSPPPSSPPPKATPTPAADDYNDSPTPGPTPPSSSGSSKDSGSGGSNLSLPPGVGRRLLQSFSTRVPIASPSATRTCAKMYLYMDTTQPSGWFWWDSDNTIEQMIAQTDSGVFISRFNSLTSMKAKSVVLKAIQYVSLPDDPPPTPPPEPQALPSPTDSASDDYDTNSPTYYTPSPTRSYYSGSSSSSSSSSSDSGGGGGGMSQGAVIAAVIGGVVVAAILAALVAMLLMKNNRRAQDKVSADLAAYRSRRAQQSVTSKNAMERWASMQAARNSRGGRKPGNSGTVDLAASPSRPRSTFDMEVDAESDTVMTGQERSAPAEVAPHSKRWSLFGGKS